MQAEARNFAILTAEISKATFGMTPSEYSRYKGLKRENLRDHMSDLELIFGSMWNRVGKQVCHSREGGNDNVILPTQNFIEPYFFYVGRSLHYGNYTKS